ncbi:MAG: HPF/RaiA family ribosome-associated protein [Burkholderiaceae bacterium]|nr:HPF/RaiA family ribosome-associated protein [Sulfuritalea sp.]MCF8176257.1 HPF/RaiA family ribosome-associated protein [Burkholderiaceae bacterium]MCF8184404.1 HPF/RaiA family ribosome-associated protein [Polynucleobacter sp.]
MHIDIQASGFELSGGLREHTERRLQFALSWASQDLGKVAVRLSDINGPRGGSDKRCRIQIPLARKPDVVIEDTETDLYVAIDRAADRAERALARRLERMREHGRESIRANPAASAVETLIVAPAGETLKPY